MDKPEVGVAVIVQNERGQILLGKRKHSFGDGMWQNPGGHLEFGESPEAAALRELKEETGLIAVHKPQRGPWVNVYVREERRHYICIFIQVWVFEGTPENLEPDKCEGWKWFDLDSLPTPLFYSMKKMIDNHDIDYVKPCRTT